MGSPSRCRYGRRRCRRQSCRPHHVQLWRCNTCRGSNSSTGTPCAPSRLQAEHRCRAFPASSPRGTGRPLPLRPSGRALRSRTGLAGWSALLRRWPDPLRSSQQCRRDSSTDLLEPRRHGRCAWRPEMLTTRTIRALARRRSFQDIPASLRQDPQGSRRRRHRQASRVHGEPGRAGSAGRSRAHRQRWSVPRLEPLGGHSWCS